MRKTIRAAVAAALSALLSGGEAWALQRTEARESRLAIVHDPLKCVTTEVRPLVDGEMRPGRDLDKGYVYFRAAGTEDFYYVLMRAEAESVSAELPRPLPGLRGIDYFLQAVDRELLSRKTPAYQPPVVEARYCVEAPAPTPAATTTEGRPRTIATQSVAATFQGPLPKLAGATVVFTSPAGAAGTLSVTRVEGPPAASTAKTPFSPNDPKTGAAVTDGARFTPAAVSPTRHWIISFAKTTGAYTLSLDVSDFADVKEPRKLYVVKRDGPGQPWTALPTFFKAGTLTATVPGGFSEFAIAGGPENPFAASPPGARGRRGARSAAGLTIGLTRAGQSPVPQGFDKRDIAFVILFGGTVVTLAEALAGAGGGSAGSTAGGAATNSAKGGGISTGVLVGAGAAVAVGVAIAAGGGGGGSSSPSPTPTATPRPTSTPTVTPTPTPTPDLPRFLAGSATWSGPSDLNVRLVGPSGDVAQLPGGRTVPAGCAAGSRTESVVYNGAAPLPAGTYTLFVRHASSCAPPPAAETFSYSVQLANASKCGGLATVNPGAEITACTFTLP